MFNNERELLDESKQGEVLTLESTTDSPENKKLLLINSFSWQTNEDILYYTLFVCEQLELNPEKFTLTITGEIEKGSVLYQLLSNYVLDINIPLNPSSFSPTLTIGDSPFHHHVILYNLALCE